MTKPRGHLRAAFEAFNREDLGLLREALLRPTEAERSFVSKLSRSLLADVEFNTDSAGQLHYRLKWMERGRLCSHGATANIVLTDSGRRDLLLDDFPDSLEPIGLLEGDFDREFFSGHQESFRLVEERYPVEREPSFGFDIHEEDHFLRLGAASEDDTFDLSLFDQETKDGESDSISLEPSTAKETENWVITWPAKGDLTIEYHPENCPDYEGLPALVSVDYEDRDGHYRKQESFVCLVPTPNKDLPIRRQSINRLELPHPGEGILVNINIRPVEKDDVVDLDESKWGDLSPIITANYLANCKFNAFTARSEPAAGQVRFISIDRYFDEPGKVHTAKVVPKHTEAVGVDEDLLEELMAIVLKTWDQLLSKAYRETGNADVAKDLVQEAVLPICRNREKYVDIVASTEVDGDGALGGEEGIRRKLFDNLRGKIGDHWKKMAKRIDAPATDRLAETMKIDALPKSTHLSIAPTQFFGDDQELDQELYQRYLSPNERMVYSVLHLTDHEMASALSADSMTVNKVRTARNNIEKKRRVLRSIHRLFRKPVFDTPLLSEAEFSFVVQAKLLGIDKWEVLKSLNVDEHNHGAFVEKINRAVEATCSAISLFEPKEASTVSFEARQFWLILEWLVRPSTISELAEKFELDPCQIEAELGRLGRIIHSQILIDREKLLSKDAKELLRHWLIDGHGLTSSMEKLQPDFAKRIATQARKKENDLKNWKPGDKELARKPRDLDVDRELSAILAAWQEVTAVPAEFRKLPEETVCIISGTVPTCAAKPST